MCSTLFLYKLSPLERRSKNKNDRNAFSESASIQLNSRSAIFLQNSYQVFLSCIYDLYFRYFKHAMYVSHSQNYLQHMVHRYTHYWWVWSVCYDSITIDHELFANAYFPGLVLKEILNSQFLQYFSLKAFSNSLFFCRTLHIQRFLKIKLSWIFPSLQYYIKHLCGRGCHIKKCFQYCSRWKGKVKISV